MEEVGIQAHAQPQAAQIRSVADAVRRRVLEHTLNNNGGYLSQACSSAEILATLYLGIMRLGSSQEPLVPRPFAGVPSSDNPHAFTGAGYNGPKAPELDRFIFSPVHYALVLYSLLIELGRLGPDALDAFNQDGSTVELIGAEHSPGHEVTAGSLAQAISQAGGIALARRLRGETGRVWVFMSDGEFQEGQTWEAFAALAYHRIGNIGIYVDANAQQCDGPMDAVMGIEPLAERLRAFGAEVHEVDGHDPEALAAPALGSGERDRPLVVIARTDPCRGLEQLRERAPKLHYVRFKSDEEFATYRTLLETLRQEAC
ncbi:transketolase [Thiorhodococcus mannitoliphagus]|uniref:Transketolase n=1 Tax=Thiorhodococcus mannitoliphagus TaxID=329406 RepID=A0A6P1DML4_9GAMM|nr:transketolase [Thiorhodococcus mannitoliphagus]NEX18780.1 transketolase [Thiorhodococcus mannitoliphagus]